MRTPLALVALVLSMTACEDIESSDLLTGGMSAVISGEADGSGETEVVVVLRAGGFNSNTLVDLTGDDELVATVGETSQTLNKRSLGVLHSYASTFDVDAADTEFAIALNRTIDAGAPRSTFQLPEAFSIDTNDDALTPTNTMNLTWSPSGTDQQMELVVDGDCITAWATVLDGDPGSYDIPGDEIDVIGDEPGRSCNIKATLRRVRGGQGDPAFDEGVRVQGAQVRSATATFSAGE